MISPSSHPLLTPLLTLFSPSSQTMATTAPMMNSYGLRAPIMNAPIMMNPYGMSMGMGAPMGMNPYGMGMGMGNTLLSPSSHPLLQPSPLTLDLLPSNHLSPLFLPLCTLNLRLNPL
jgi:hypothetical protein